MALTLQQIRDYVRLHLDLEVDDLPDVAIDIFVREGSRRIERAEPRWPFYEVRHDFALIQGQESELKATIDPLLDQIVSIRHDPTTAWPPLVWIGFDAFVEQQTFRPLGQGRPVYFSEWGDKVYFHPTPDQGYTLTVSGYRHADDWVNQGAGASPDLPDDLHNTVALWAVSKAYYQQEDDVLGATFERQFSDELNEYRRRLVITPYHQPVVLGGGAVPEVMQRLGRPRFDWENR